MDLASAFNPLPEPPEDLIDIDLFASLDRYPEKLKNFLVAAATDSPHLKSLIMRDPERLDHILQHSLEDTLTAASAALFDAANEAEGEAEMMTAVRVHKQMTALAIGLWDLSEACDLDTILFALTDAADDAVGATLRFLIRQQIDAGKCTYALPPKGLSGLGIVALAMGKHGAQELNYSSDVDLIILYDPAAPVLADDQEPSVFWVRLIKRFVRILQERTGDGYGYRVDLRLRPDPSSTPLAVSIPAALQYYESMGQNWERAALIKARPIAGDLDLGDDFLREIVPFIWRKYLDYVAIDDIHSIKRQIHVHKGFTTICSAGHNIKLGRGGIREVEFFVQTQQLIAGGRNPMLRGRRTLEMLAKLAELDWIESAPCEEMDAAYKRLRKIENRIQMMADEQTHIVPDDPLKRAALARLCGDADLEVFDNALIDTLKRVQGHYERLFEGSESLADEYGNLVFTGDEDDPSTVETLSRLGFENPTTAISQIRGWHYGRIAATRSEHARAMLTQLVPALIREFAEGGQPDQALAGFDRFVSGLPAGLQLFTLLKSNPRLLKLLSVILGAAPRLARVITRRPHVLDALLDPTFFSASFSRNEFEAQLRQMCDQARDFEDALDRARIVGQQQLFLIGVRLLTSTIRPQEAGQAYSALAEATVNVMLDVVWRDFERRHGHVPGARLVVLGMGKLGSREMTASSDLDLILLYDFDKNCNQSDGEKPLAVSLYFIRLTQRLITALSAPTGEGTLYELDFRLRPSGNAGPLATQFSTFRAYQREQAWTWERMALTRARVIAGDLELGEEVEKDIRDLLTGSTPADLMNDATEMLVRIHEAKPSKSIWDIKTAHGGLVDVEFMAQVLQLEHAPQHPDLLNHASEEVFAIADQRQLLAGNEALVLRDAFQTYQLHQQLLRMAYDNAEETGEFLQSKGFVSVLTNACNLPTVEHVELQLKETREAVEEVVKRFGLSESGI